MIMRRVFTNESLAALVSSIKQYTDSAIAKLVNSAPSTLDTLGELAAALEENEDVVDALDAAITSKANEMDLEAAVARIDSIEDLISSNAIMLPDAKTGDMYVIQIHNGRLVTMLLEEFEVAQ